VAKLRVELLSGNVLALDVSTASVRREKKAQNRWRKRVRAEGLEPWTRRSQNLNHHAILQ
jgi:hypothetical protein